MTPSLEAQDLFKTYRRGLFGRGRVEALRGVNLAALPGEIFGLLGPNGAGKSTLVKSLLGLVKPSGGTATLLGRPAGRTSARRDVGYLPEQAKFPPYLTGRQTVSFFAGLGGMSRWDRHREADRLLDRLGLSDAADRKVGGYSKGMRQRVGLAQALAAGPPGRPPGVLILDEPTDGVDPLARKLIRDVLQETRDAGSCVFLNSHLLGELEQVCDRCAVMVGGQAVAGGTPAELAGGRGDYRIEVVEPLDATRMAIALGVPVKPDAEAFDRDDGRPAAFHVLPPGIRVSLLTPTTLSLDTLDPAVASGVLDRLRAAGVIVVAFRPVRPTLEDLFVDAVSRSKP